MHFFISRLALFYSPDVTAEESVGCIVLLDQHIIIWFLSHRQVALGSGGSTQMCTFAKAFAARIHKVWCNTYLWHPMLIIIFFLMCLFFFVFSFILFFFFCFSFLVIFPSLMNECLTKESFRNFIKLLENSCT